MGAAVVEDDQGHKGTATMPLAHGTNNQAEYAGLIVGLMKAEGMDITEVEVFGDSMLVVKQMQGAWRVKSEGLRPYYLRAYELARKFDAFKIDWIPREENAEADALSNGSAPAAP